MATWSGLFAYFMVAHKRAMTILSGTMQGAYSALLMTTHSVQFAVAVCSVPCTLYSVQCAVCSMKCSVGSVKFKVRPSKQASYDTAYIYLVLAKR